ncbi:Peroxiredoxin [Celeribacter baekdonensis]|uniref:Glutathione-dependent peroxiredoxin n=1 Tax=Celeribacter baekdonensis TaxID=875171 RepID=A0A1G7N531_9RHOB|nr:peroxiredoxin [Celeribacter baekdonensis]SDF68997.1 Peroxiredoxin [Celeribacter baekdonensis]
MTISVGDTLPGGTVLELGAEGPASVDLATKFKGRNVVLFGLPGAYTGVCTTAHVPSFIRTKDAFAAKGVDEVICVSVNDPFVMGAWAKDTGADVAGLSMLGDAEGTFIKALGLDFTAPPAGLIGRSKRFALYAEDGVVKVLQVETSPGECTVSAGESLLEAI